MAYELEKLSALVSGLSGKSLNIWGYESSDTLAAVKAANYIADGQARRMNLGDVVYFRKVDGAGVVTATHQMAVTAVQAAGDGVTLGALTPA